MIHSPPEQPSEMALAAAHFASLPRARRSALQAEWAPPPPYTIDPAHLANIEREFEAAAVDPRERIV